MNPERTLDLVRIHSAHAAGANYGPAGAVQRKLDASHIQELALKYARVTAETVLEAAWHCAQNEVSPSKVRRSAMVGDVFTLQVELTNGARYTLSAVAGNVGFNKIRLSPEK